MKTITNCNKVKAGADGAILKHQCRITTGRPSGDEKPIVEFLVRSRLRTLECSGLPAGRERKYRIYKG